MSLARVATVSRNRSAGGWTAEGALGGGASLLARDPDGNLLEFVENPGAPG